MRERVTVAIAIATAIVVVGCSGSDGNGDLIGPSNGVKPGATASEAAATTPGKTSKKAKTDGGADDDAGVMTSGGDGGAPAQCRMATGQAGCDACLAAKCCDAVKTCNANTSCQPLYNCLDKCGEADQACQSTCIASLVDGREALREVLVCGEERCPTECE